MRRSGQEYVSRFNVLLKGWVEGLRIILLANNYCHHYRYPFGGYNMGNTICVVGLGYVGLPLAIAFDRRGQDVIGYDVSEEKVESLSSGYTTIEEVSEGAVEESSVTFTSDPNPISDADYVIITVPTPVSEFHMPDLSFVEDAGETVGKYMSRDTTVVLESTVFPGATENILIPKIEQASEFSEGEEFQVGYSPERVSPGDTKYGLRDLVKVVGARTANVRDDLASLYELIIDAGVYRAPSIQTAEAAKILENIQRDLNIALVNEFSVACDYLDLDTREVLKAAETKENFHDGYRPGFVGGHCIPIDPHYFAYCAESAGFDPKLVLLAREINEYMPKHVSELTIKSLNQCRKVPKQSRILVLGVTYKPDVGDVRTSKVHDFVECIEKYDVTVVGYDPYVESEDNVLDIEMMTDLSFDGFDGVVLTTPHAEFKKLDLETIEAGLNERPVLVDLQGVFEEDEAVEKGFEYRKL